MKARVVRRAPLALAYGCADEERLREVFAAMGAQVRVLKGEDWGTRLGVLAGEAGPAGEAEAAAPQQSVLVFDAHQPHLDVANAFGRAETRARAY